MKATQVLMPFVCLSVVCAVMMIPVTISSYISTMVGYMSSSFDKQAIKRIEECHKTRSYKLDLGKLWITQIPKEILELHWLREVDICFNRISDISILKKLSQLVCIDISYNLIHSLDFLEFFPELTSLSCQFNKLDSLKSIKYTPGLKYLNCSNNELKKLDHFQHIPLMEDFHCRRNQINDLSQLQYTPNLKSIDISFNSISDLSALQFAPKLLIINCACNSIGNMDAIEKCPQLEELDCSGNHLNNMDFLRHLSSIRSFDCSGNQLGDFSGLRHVPELQSLRLGDNKINDLNFLQHTPKLKSLDCEESDLISLNGLKHVPHLLEFDCGFNKITELYELKYTPDLISLDCSHNQLVELEGLMHIRSLQSLRCHSNQLKDLSALRHVPEITSIDCRSNNINNIDGVYDFIMSRQLSELKLSDNSIQSIPPIIFNDKGGKCQDNLYEYWLDLKSGSVDINQLKVQFTGNGRVGKTTLAYALEHKKGPAKNLKSTHGITIREIPHSLDSSDNPVNLQFWDFGGQEIYHATHRLFLGDDCLYLLLWAEETEEHPEETRHPVSYWLELIHDLAPNSPIILIKNQIDRSDKQSARPPELADDELPGVKQIRQDVKISAQKYQRMNSLRGAIEDVLEELQHRVCLKLPKSWVNVEDKLKALNEKTLPYEQFHQLCAEAKINDPEWFADYLHKTGFLFYRKGAFQDQIILDQNWAIKAVYCLFDPKGYRPVIENMQGHFDGRMTNMFWSESSETDRKIYLSFMHNCGICYEPDRGENHHKPFVERKFIVPALLPMQSAAQNAWNKQPNDWQLDIEYNFLHRSIIERLILRLDETYTGEPWRNGIFCTTEFGRLLLEHDPSIEDVETTQKRISCHLRADGQPTQLLYALRKLVRDVSPHQRYQEYLRKGEEERQPLKVFKEKENSMPSQLDEQPPAKTVRLFISYSRTDREHKLTLEKYLRIVKDALKYKVNFVVWSDNSMDAGEGVNEQIMPELKRADIIVLLASPDFFDPDRYSCREELPIALQRHSEEGIPVIPVVLRHTSAWTEKVGHLTVATEENALPLEDWPSADKYWDSVATGIRTQVEKSAGLE